MLYVRTKIHFSDPRFGDGKFYRVSPKKLTKVQVGPREVAAPKGKCQSLKKEANLQLRRLTREMERIQQERLVVLQILEETHQVSEAKSLECRRSNTASPSPTCISLDNMSLDTQESDEVDPIDVEVADANLQSILRDCGAFASASVFVQPSHSHSPGRPTRSILPPL